MSDTTIATRGHRIVHYDLLKGIAIYMVVMGHVLTMCIRDIDAAFVFKFIGQTHMPLFFFISGFMSWRQQADGSTAMPVSTLVKRARQLLVPMLLVSALWVVYFPHSGIQSPLHTTLPGLYSAYWKDGYWFPLCLMELTVLYWVLSRVLQALKACWLRVAVLVVTYGLLIALALATSTEDCDWAGTGLLAQFFPIYMLGAAAGKHREAFARLCCNGAVMTAALLVFVPTFYCTVYPWDIPVESAVMDAASWVIVPLMQASWTVLAIAMVTPWGKRVEQVKLQGERPGLVSRIFLLLGNHSLGIYLWHFFFLFPMPFLQEPMRAVALQAVPLLAVSAVVAAGIIAVTLLWLRMLGCSPLLAEVLTGKLIKRENQQS